MPVISSPKPFMNIYASTAASVSSKINVIARIMVFSAHLLGAACSNKDCGTWGTRPGVVTCAYTMRGHTFYICFASYFIIIYYALLTIKNLIHTLVISRDRREVACITA